MVTATTTHTIAGVMCSIRYNTARCTLDGYTHIVRDANKHSLIKKLRGIIDAYHAGTL